MLIAIDYDDTWTLHPMFWESFFATCNDYGYMLICVTGRHSHEPVKLPADIPVVYAGDQFKRAAAEQAGYQVDVWIDDQPGHVEPCRKLEWSE